MEHDEGGNHAGHGHGEAQAGHGHGHGDPTATPASAFAIGIGLNLTFVVVEVVYGLLAHSMALVADAGHNLGDVLGLGLAWGAALLAKRRPTLQRTYGLRGTTILASLTNSVVLLFVTGGIAWESVRRLLAPEQVHGATVIVVALVGVVINGASALLFMAGRKGDLNIRSAFMHLAADAALALGVAVAATVMMFTGWAWIDPVVSVLLSAFILASTWSLLKDSTNLILAGVPEGIDGEAVRRFLSELPGVQEVHDFHVWAMSTTENALTAHLVMPTDKCHPKFLGDACHAIQEKFGVGHCTLQVESPDAPHRCGQAPEGAV
jgi:cobalt-zinc-cadmium efflux system protein